MGIKENLDHIKNTFKDHDCLLVAVSKTKPIGAIQEAYEAGIRDFGENKVQELAEKAPQLPKDIRWHMIGHLQRNKVKYIASFVHLIHGVDSLRLLNQINKEGEKINRVIPCLLQMHIAMEESKFGLDENEVEEIIWGEAIRKMDFIQVRGLMGMATNTENKKTIQREFRSLKVLFEKIKSTELPKQVKMEILSMGMSGDYAVALEEGSNMVRIGSAIFGAGNYEQ